VTGRRRTVAWALVAALATAGLLRACDRAAPPPPAERLVVDTASAAQWRARAERHAREAAEAKGAVERLRRELAGIERRAPRTVTVYDTIVDLRQDTVILAARVDGSGVLTLDVATPDSAGHRPATARGIRLGDCDDGWTVRGLDVQCNRARLGHLSVIGRAGVETRPAAYPELTAAPAIEAGIRWTPSYRSTWAVEATAAPGGRAILRIEKGLRIF
jgi:hypothetical protein